MNEKTISSRTAFEGRLLRLEVQEVALDNGVRTRREIVRHPGAVAVVARDGNDRFLFVRQFRKPIEQELLEIVAGCLEPGEEPEACARRELREETGVETRRLQLLGTLYTVPGYSNERMYVFAADVKDGRAGPAPDQDENVEPVWLPRREVEKRLRDGAFHDAKTVAAWCLFERRAEP